MTRASLQFTRIVLGIQVLSTGAILPARFLLRKNVRQTLAVLLGPVMLVQTLVVAGFAKGSVVRPGLVYDPLTNECAGFSSMGG